jgi:hypothetical protein
MIEIIKPNGGANLCINVAATPVATPAAIESKYFI